MTFRLPHSPGLLAVALFFSLTAGPAVVQSAAVDVVSCSGAGVALPIQRGAGASEPYGGTVADQKRWFKVWTSILLDPVMDSLPLEDVGRWVRLGALAAQVGDSGRLEFPPDAHTLSTALKCPDLACAKACLSRLPNIQFEEGKNRYGGLTVTLLNWRKYQEDSTTAQRMKTLRSKRRGEEKRGEEKRIPPTNSPHKSVTAPLPSPPLPPALPPSIAQALDRTTILGAVAALRSMTFWTANIRATNNGHVDYADELLKAEAWLTANPTRAPRKDLARFMHNWLARARERSV